MTPLPDEKPSTGAAVVGSGSMSLARARTLREVWETRYTFAAALVFDTGVLAVAYLCRAALLGLAHVLDPDAANWAIHALELLSDVGTVGTAAAFVTLDLWSRFRELYRDVREGSHG